MPDGQPHVETSLEANLTAEDSLMDVDRPTRRPSSPAIIGVGIDSPTTNSVVFWADINPGGLAGTLLFKFGETSGALGEASTRIDIPASFYPSRFYIVQSGKLNAGNTTYYQAVASNPKGMGTSVEQSWVVPTGPTPPDATTGAHTNATSATVELAGTVNPNGTDTNAYFEVRRAATQTAPAGEWAQTTSVNVGSGSSPVAVGPTLVDLGAIFGSGGPTGGVEYDWRMVGENVLGDRGTGDVESFTTPAGGGKPIWAAFGPATVEGAMVTIPCTVDPTNRSTDVFVNYGLTSGYPGNQQAVNVGTIPANSGPTQLVAVISELPVGAYTLEGVAKNNYGDSPAPSALSATIGAATGPTGIATLAPTGVTKVAMRLRGQVNPQGTDTDLLLRYRVKGQTAWTEAGSVYFPASTVVEQGSIPISGLLPGTVYEVEARAFWRGAVPPNGGYGEILEAPTNPFGPVAPHLTFPNPTNHGGGWVEFDALATLVDASATAYFEYQPATAGTTHPYLFRTPDINLPYNPDTQTHITAITENENIASGVANNARLVVTTGAGVETISANATWTDGGGPVALPSFGAETTKNKSSDSIDLEAVVNTNASVGFTLQWTVWDNQNLTSVFGTFPAVGLPITGGPPPPTYTTKVTGMTPNTQYWARAKMTDGTNDVVSTVLLTWTTDDVGAAPVLSNFQFLAAGSDSLEFAVDAISNAVAPDRTIVYFELDTVNPPASGNPNYVRSPNINIGPGTQQQFGIAHTFNGVAPGSYWCNAHAFNLLGSDDLLDPGGPRSPSGAGTAPIVQVQGPDLIHGLGWRFRGQVNPQGQAGCRYWWAYKKTTDSTWIETSKKTLAGSPSSLQFVTMRIPNPDGTTDANDANRLEPGTAYDVELRADIAGANPASSQLLNAGTTAPQSLPGQEIPTLTPGPQTGTGTLEVGHDGMVFRFQYRSQSESATAQVMLRSRIWVRLRTASAFTPGDISGAHDHRGEFFGILGSQSDGKPETVVFMDTIEGLTKNTAYHWQVCAFHINGRLVTVEGSTTTIEDPKVTYGANYTVLNGPSAGFSVPRDFLRRVPLYKIWADVLVDPADENKGHITTANPFNPSEATVELPADWPSLTGALFEWGRVITVDVDAKTYTMPATPTNPTPSAQALPAPAIGQEALWAYEHLSFIGCIIHVTGTNAGRVETSSGSFDKWSNGHPVTGVLIRGDSAANRIGSVMHAYSIASAPWETETKGFLEFYVVQEVTDGVPGRLSTVFLGMPCSKNEPVNYVDRIAGHFTLETHAGHARSIVLIGTGTGLSPFVSMIKQLHHEGADDRRYTLIHTNRTRPSSAITRSCSTSNGPRRSTSATSPP